MVPRPELSIWLTSVRSRTTHSVSGISPRTVLCSRAEVLDVILPVQRTMVSPGVFTASRVNSEIGIGFAVMTGLLCLEYAGDARHCWTRSRRGPAKSESAEQVRLGRTPQRYSRRKQSQAKRHEKSQPWAILEGVPNPADIARVGRFSGSHGLKIHL